MQHLVLGVWEFEKHASLNLWIHFSLVLPNIWILHGFEEREWISLCSQHTRGRTRHAERDNGANEDIYGDGKQKINKEGNAPKTLQRRGTKDNWKNYEGWSVLGLSAIPRDLLREKP